MEALLHPHHPRSPVPPNSPAPVYWVTPRHLAGDDHTLAERIGDTLTTLGWRMWPTARNTLLHTSPDGLRGAEWTLAAHPFELGGLPVAWQVSARTHATSVMTEWNAYFTPGTPHEALADLLRALHAHQAPTAPSTGTREAVLVTLTAQGWFRDLDHPHTTATDPGFSSCLSSEAVPPLIQDADPRPDGAGWQAWAQPRRGEPYLWCAAFSPSVPHELVAAFAASLASPVPVPRHTLPDSSRDRLVVVHRT
ncbi:DUF317 domain-containing protein [Streptomyces sp. NPDC088789]|uniref:DUF317 domain-containing protein n=1 Tax=Streptomyces sp. NPDC088789 TaxID=3365899 RepID=UPI0037F848BA